MSNTSDLVRDLNDFLRSLDELLRTRTAQEAPNIARDLGAVPQFNSALDLLGSGLGQVDGGVAAAQGVVTQADSAVAGFEVLAAAIRDFGEGDALVEAARLVELPTAPFETVAGGVARGGRCLEQALGVADVLPSPNDLRATRARLQQLQATVAALKARPAAAPAPAPAQAPASLSAPQQT